MLLTLKYGKCKRKYDESHPKRFAMSNRVNRLKYASTQEWLMPGGYHSSESPLYQQDYSMYRVFLNGDGEYLAKKLILRSTLDVNVTHDHSRWNHQDKVHEKGFG